MSQTLVQKLGALGYVSPLIQSPKPSLQKSAMSLVGNLSRTASLQSTMGKIAAWKIEYLSISN